MQQTYEVNDAQVLASGGIMVREVAIKPGTSNSVLHPDPVNSQEPPTQDKPKMKSHKETLARLKEKISNKRILNLSRTNGIVTQGLATKAKTRLLNVSSRQTLLASNKALALALAHEKKKSSAFNDLLNNTRHVCSMYLFKIGQVTRCLEITREKYEEAQNALGTLQHILVKLSNNNGELLDAGLKVCAQTCFSQNPVNLGQAGHSENHRGASPANALPSEVMTQVVATSHDKEEVDAPEKQSECSPRNPGPVASTTTTGKQSEVHSGFSDTTATEENPYTPLGVALEINPSYITSRRRKNSATDQVPAVITEETNAVGATECEPPALEVTSSRQLVPDTNPDAENTVYSQLDMEMTCECSVNIEIVRTNKTNPSLGRVQPSASKAKVTVAHRDERENEKENEKQGGGVKSRKKNSSDHVSNVSKDASIAKRIIGSGSVAAVERAGASNAKYKSSATGGGGHEDRAGGNESAFDFDLQERAYSTPFHSKSSVAVMEEDNKEECEPCMLSPWTKPPNRKRRASSTATGASVETPKQLNDRTNEIMATTVTPPSHCLQYRQSEPKMSENSFSPPDSRRRCRSLVNYTMPKINTKLRRGDNFTDGQFLSSPIYKSNKKKPQKQRSKRIRNDPLKGPRFGTS